VQRAFASKGWVAGFAAFAALVLVIGTTYALVGLPGRVAPRLAAIDAPGMPVPDDFPLDPGPTEAPAPDPSADPGATGRGGGPANVSNNNTGSPPGAWLYSDAGGPLFGYGGPVYYYRVAVESGVPVSPAEFAGTVDGALGGYRG
jgi:hypothetical protein